LIEGTAIEVVVLSFLLILTRVGTFVAVFPLFGGSNLPRTIKIGLALALAWMWFGVFGTAPAEAVVQAATGRHWLALAAITVREAVFGGLLGFGFGLFLVPLQIAGAYVAQEMGLTLASISDPTSGAPRSVLAQLFESLGALLFFGLDVHHVLLTTVHATLQRWPCGSPLSPLPTGALLHGVGDAQQWGLLLVAPVGICLFVTAVVLTYLAKASPQLNLFSVGFAARVGAGLVACLIFLPDMWLLTQHMFGKTAGFIQVLLRVTPFDGI
jgi:flagellar biosynthetic protein FliR